MPLLLRREAPSPSIEQLAQAWRGNGNNRVTCQSKPKCLDDLGDERSFRKQECTPPPRKEARATTKDSEREAGDNNGKSFRRSRTVLCLSDGESDGENGSPELTLSDSPINSDKTDPKQDSRPTLLDRSSINKALARLKISEAHVAAVEKELQRLRMGVCARFQSHIKSFSTRIFRSNNRN